MSQNLEKPAGALANWNRPVGGWGTIVGLSRVLLIMVGMVLNWFHGALAMLGGVLIGLYCMSFAMPALLYLRSGRVQGPMRSAITTASGWMLAALSCPFSIREASTVFDIRIVWTFRTLFAAGLVLAMVGGFLEKRARKGLST